jgi:cell division septation protein DedD
MRRILVALVAVLVVGCGGDDAEQQPARSESMAEASSAMDTAESLGQATADTGQAADVPPGEAGAEQSGAATGPGGEGAADSPRPVARGGTSGPPLYTIQVAAFLDSDSAEEWTGRLREHGWPVWSSVAEVGGELFHRVRVGALPTVDEARRLGSALARRYEWPVWLAPVAPADPVPPNAVEATRSALDQG